MATGLAKAGANVMVFDITPPSPEFQSISTLHNVRTAYQMVDVSQVPALRQSFEAVKLFYADGLDICIAAAGVNCLRDFLETEEEDFDRVMTINVKGVYYACQLSARAMIESGKSGSIIVISSTSAYTVARTHNSSVYTSSKSAVKGLVPELAKELGRYGIRINSISPGYTLTNMTKGYPEFVKQWEADTMLGYIGTPDDYQGAAIYLAGPASRYVTGQDFLIDGGTTKW